MEPLKIKQQHAFINRLSTKRHALSTMIWIFFRNYHKTIILLILISIASLANFSSVTPDDLQLFPHFDKVVHLSMYFTLTFVFLWENYLRHHLHIVMNRAFIISIIIILVGIGMELLQINVTDTRSGDMADAYANISGLTLGWIIFTFSLRITKIKNICIRVFKV